jgi:hypothetical protein
MQKKITNFKPGACSACKARSFINLGWSTGQEQTKKKETGTERKPETKRDRERYRREGVRARERASDQKRWTGRGRERARAQSRDGQTDKLRVRHLDRKK